MTSSHKPIENRSGIDWPVILFFLLAYVLAWGTIGIMAVIARSSGLNSGLELMGMAEALDFQGHENDLTVPAWILYILSRIADFSFTLSGIIVVAYTAGTAGLVTLFRKLIQWRVPVKWYAVALFPFLLYGLAAAVTASGDMTIRDGFRFAPATIRTMLFSAHAGFLVMFFLRGAMGEELGLRGFALTRLQQQYSPARASLLIGVAWAGWHIPVLVGRNPVEIGLVLFLILLLSFIFTWIYNNTGQSLIPVMLFHASQNSEEIMEVLLPGLVGTNWELLSSLGILVLGLSVMAWVVWESRKAVSEPALV